MLASWAAKPLALGVIWWIVGLGALAGLLRDARPFGRSQDRATRMVHVDDAPSDHTGLDLSSLSLGSSLVCLPGRQRVGGDRGQLDGARLYRARRAHRSASRPGSLAWRAREPVQYVAAWCFSLAAVIAVHHMEWFYPAIARWVPAPTKRWAAPFRIYEPTARLRGHQVVARAVAEKVQALEARGESPFVLTATYGLTSTLSFYLPGPARNLLPELELRHDSRAREPARPLASEPAP